MATAELVAEQFESLGIEVEGEILLKCVALCRDYDVDPETLVEQWMAFSLSHMDGAPPTFESLAAMEKKEFSQLHKPLTGQEPARGAGASKVPLPVYGGSDDVLLDNDAILSNYIPASTPKRATVKVERPSSYQAEITPATYSPTASHSAKYSSRTNSGTVLTTYGEESALKGIDGPCELNMLELNIAQVPNEDGVIFTNKAMFGFELLNEKAGTFDNHIRYLSSYIMKKAGLTDDVSVRCKSQSEVLVCGRVECDADARLNSKSALLQGTWERSLSQAVPLDLDQVSQYSVFPGQVVAARGTNPRGDRFLATQLYSDAALPPPPPASALTALAGTLSIVVAAGPYTTSDSLAYEPLKDLVAYAQKNRPNLVIMMGPFLDSDHALVKDNTMAETYKAFFDKLLDNVAEITSVSPSTRVVVVSSLRDAFHVNVYPTPSYASRRKHAGVSFAPDPCTLDVHGVLLGLTTTDVLMHLSQEEISMGVGGDKLSRLAGHVLAQQSFYPLCPAPASLPLDAALWAQHAQFTRSPHILILPSCFRYFAKEVNGCVVINPEHLSKGTGGGTFARIQIKPKDNEPLSKGIGVQIIRI